ncbi:MAG TPA: hypothetical protein VML55_09935 [Planctomycetaceae bacterium]|nr:hypothetical protein [Planctomycetaceae bacterium]
MTLTITLPPDLEQRLVAEAERRGVSADECTVQLLAQSLPPEDRAARAVALIQSWIDDEDATEQQETRDYLIKALDEDRPSNRKLFPPELKGVSW